MAEETVGDRMDSAFRDGSIFAASDDDLKAYLAQLGSERIENETVRHRAITRSQVISTVRSFKFLEMLEAQNQAFIKGIEKENSRLALIALIVSIFAAGLAGYSLYDSGRSSKAFTTKADEILAALESQRVLESQQVELLKAPTEQGDKKMSGGKMGSKK